MERDEDDAKDRGPHAAPLAVEALRALDEAESPGRHAAMRRELLSLLRAVPGAELRVGAGVEAGTEVPRIDCLLPAAQREVAAVLASCYRLGPLAPGTPGPGRWSLTSALSPAGFAVAGRPGPRRFDPPPGAEPFGDRWTALAAQHPGLRLEVAAHAGRADGYVVRVAVTGEGPLPIRVAAFLRERFPGFIPVAGVDAADLEVSTDVAAELLPLPWTPRSGAAVGDPPPLPLRPQGVGGASGAIRLGAAVLPSGRATEVGLRLDELPRHVHVLGQTGTGKSTLLAAITRGLAEQGLGYLLLDPHGALVDRCLAELPERAAARTVLIRASDLAHPVPINPLAVEDETRFETVLQDLVLVFYRLFDRQRSGIVGPRFESLLTHAVRGLRALHGTRVSLLDVPRVYQDRSLERAVAAAVTDPRQVDFWRREMPSTSEHTRSEMLGWFTSKFDRFATTAAMRAVLGTGADAYDPADAIDEDRIVLVDLSKGALGAVAADLLGFLHLSRLWTGFQQRRGDRPYGVIVDEAQSFDAAALPAMLAEGRKHGASVVLAHQFLGQLDGELQQAVEGNAGTTVAFRSGPTDAERLRARMGEDVPLSRYTAAADLTAVLHRASGGASGRPHSLLVDHRERVEPRTGDALSAFEARIAARTRSRLVEPFRVAADQERPPTVSETESVLLEWQRRRARRPGPQPDGSTSRSR